MKLPVKKTKTITGNMKLRNKRAYLMYYVSKHLVEEFAAFGSRVHLDVPELLRIMLTALVAGHPGIRSDFDEIIRSGVREATVGFTRISTALDPEMYVKFERLAKRTANPFTPSVHVAMSDIAVGTILWVLKNQKRLVAYETICLPIREKDAKPARRKTKEKVQQESHGSSERMEKPMSDAEQA